MKKIGICGNFSFGNKPEGGQTIRTHIITEELISKYGKEQVECIDTHNWKKNKFKLFYNCLKISFTCKNVFILPAHNGITVFIPLFVLLTKVLKKKLHYIVVGAWLADDLKKNRALLKQTKNIDYIYVQTDTLKNKLKELDVFKNVYSMPNFKSINPLGLEELVHKFEQPYKVCMLSRVNERKGIENAIKVVSQINNNSGKIKILLDIYGPVEKCYEYKFNQILDGNSDFVSYRGSVNYDKTIDVLKNYYLLLFPTKYYTEGFPGTIIDAFLSGLPVLASRWESCYDIIEEGVTGMTYEFNNDDDFYNKLSALISDQEKVQNMKENCLKEAKKYTSESALKNLLNNLV